MNKLDFIFMLHEKLSALPQKELEDRLNFYTEMIEERMEEGLSEEEAVAAVGSVDEIAAQILSECQPCDAPKPKKRTNVWTILLLVLGSPVWLSILIAVFAVILSVYVSLWSVLISLWAVFASLVGSGIGCIAGGILFAFTGYVPSGLACIAMGLVCAGLSIFTFYGCNAATKSFIRLTKICFQKIFSKKEVA